ncbi:MAPEG family protein [Emericellopsis cladophorae]|uniref:MAPEG family protein n=1 Tax=Emericellopsis cladophorae TaxID=2686198 RepID=A0A9P9Y4I5_9HYPO|nr:MAPEG family protein [Emericellopsis cladophorae]KAI6783190.1 MAPEG family protein [Emericellopsis cladophorae]
MPFTLQLPDEYGSTFLLNTYHFYLTSTSRRASGVAYPAPYASDEQIAKNPKAFTFNCAQRAHANFIENQPSFLGALAISGLRFPMASAVLGATWAFGRLAYVIGYTSSAGPKGRVFGFLVSALSDNALRLMAMYASVMYVMDQ